MKEKAFEKLSSFLKEEFGSNSIVGYHGTDKNFNSFRDTKPIFFVDDINVARTYGDVIIKAKLNIDNPVIFDFNEGSTIFFYNKWYVPSDLANFIKEISDDIKNFISVDDDILEELERHEYNGLSGELDGIIMQNIKDANDGIFSRHNAATNYVVFDKSQIEIIKQPF